MKTEGRDDDTSLLTTEGDVEPNATVNGVPNVLLVAKDPADAVSVEAVGTECELKATSELVGIDDTVGRPDDDTETIEPTELLLETVGARADTEDGREVVGIAEVPNRDAETVVWGKEEVRPMGAPETLAL